MFSKSFNDIARVWNEYGSGYAKYKSLWDNSLVLATLGPQFGGGLTARDFSGRQNHGTLTNGPTWSNQTYRGQTFRGGSFVGGANDISPPAGRIRDGAAEVFFCIRNYYSTNNCN